MTKKISWLHLSDIHIKKENDYDQDVVLSSMLEDIAAESDRYSYDIIFLTGDVAFSGKESEYTKARRFISDLSFVSKVPFSNIFCVPGNHDVDRSLISTRPLLESRNDVSKLIGDQACTELALRPQDNYFRFIKDTFPWAQRFKRGSLQTTVNIIVNGVRLAILLLNSSWRSGTDDDLRQNVVGERQVRDALKEVEEPQVIFAALHHPASYLAEFDALDVEGLLNSRCDFVLHGHIHQFGAVALRSPDSEVFYLAAGATHAGGRAASYNHAFIDFDKGTCRVSIRRYADVRGGFWAPDTLMYTNAPDGILEFTLPGRITGKVGEERLRDVERTIKSLTTSATSTVAAGSTLPEDLPDVPDPPNELVEAIVSGRCMLFAGSGASVDAQLPTWPQLVSDLVDEAAKAAPLSKEQRHELACLIESAQYLAVAEFCREKIRLNQFSRYLQRRLSNINRMSSTHAILSSIPFRGAITTNYDRFIEASRSGANVITPQKMESIYGSEYLHPSMGFPVIKISGSLEDVKSIILTQSDFRRLSYSSPRYIAFVRKLLTDFTVFFYGSGFVDPNVNYLLQGIYTETEGMSPAHYAVIPEQGPIKREFWYTNFNVRVITYPLWEGSHRVAREFLQKLADECGTREGRGHATIR